MNDSLFPLEREAANAGEPCYVLRGAAA